MHTGRGVVCKNVVTKQCWAWSINDLQTYVMFLALELHITLDHSLESYFFLHVGFRDHWALLPCQLSEMFFVLIPEGHDRADPLSNSLFNVFPLTPGFTQISPTLLSTLCTSRLPKKLLLSSPLSSMRFTKGQGPWVSLILFLHACRICPPPFFFAMVTFHITKRTACFLMIT